MQSLDLAKLPNLTQLINEAKSEGTQIPSHVLLPYAVNAIINNDVATLKLIDANGFNFCQYITAGLIPGKNVTLVHLAANNSSLPSLEVILTSAKRQGIDILKIKDQYGHNIFQYAMHRGQADVTKMIAEKLARPDLFKDGYIHKPQDGALTVTLLQPPYDTLTPDKAIPIKKLLELAGFAANLDYQSLILSPNCVYDFSGVSLKYSNITVNDLDTHGCVSFANADLEGAMIMALSGIATSDKIIIKNSNIKNLSGIFDSHYAELLNRGGANTIPLNKKDYKDQLTIFELKNLNLCARVSLEATRSFMRKTSKQKDINDFEENFLAKFNDDSKANFLDRITHYQTLSQKCISTLKTTVLKSEDDLNKFLSDHSATSMLGIFLSDCHIVTVRVKKEADKIVGFKIINHGFSTSFEASDYKSLYKILQSFNQGYKTTHLYNDIKILDLEDYVQQLELVANHSIYKKESKAWNKLVLALQKNNLEEIKKLSAAQKIDSPFNPVNVDELVKQAITPETSILIYALKNSSKEAMIALISSNNKLNLISKVIQYQITSNIENRDNLNINDKTAIIQTCLNKAIELKQTQAISYFQEWKAILALDYTNRYSPYEPNYSPSQQKLVDEKDYLDSKACLVLESMVTYQDSALL